jgi:DNA-binding NtrC family response regulator
MEDLPRLVDHFVRKYALKNGKPVKRVSPEALEMLRKHTWPGNVRELEKCLEHAVVFADGDEIVPDNLKDEITGAAGAGILPAADWTGSLPDKVARLEEFCIAEALAAADWNKTQAARSLGIHESTLRKKVKAYSIEKPRT